MHPAIYSEFRSIVASLNIQGRVLEIGVNPRAASLLAMDLLQGTERVGLDLEGSKSVQGFEILEGNGNDMPMFADSHFDLVLCNAMLEHDRYFWKTCAEIRRVLRTGGTAIIGAPAFTVASGISAEALATLPFDVHPMDTPHAALTFRYHGVPLDYYRFSEDAFAEVIFEGYSNVALKSVLMPPRIIGYGFKR
jgi:ubiquinone/menaquinone biosynthesis C-methylase UbiE